MFSPVVLSPRDEDKHPRDDEVCVNDEAFAESLERLNTCYFGFDIMDAEVTEMGGILLHAAMEEWRENGGGGGGDGGGGDVSSAGLTDQYTVPYQQPEEVDEPWYHFFSCASRGSAVGKRPQTVLGTGLPMDLGQCWEQEERPTDWGTAGTTGTAGTAGTNGGNTSGNKSESEKSRLLSPALFAALTAQQLEQVTSRQGMLEYAVPVLDLTSLPASDKFGRLAVTCRLDTALPTSGFDEGGSSGRASSGSPADQAEEADPAEIAMAAALPLCRGSPHRVALEIEVFGVSAEPTEGEESGKAELLARLGRAEQDERARRDGGISRHGGTAGGIPQGAGTHQQDHAAYQEWTTKLVHPGRRSSEPFVPSSEQEGNGAPAATRRGGFLRDWWRGRGRRGSAPAVFSHGHGGQQWGSTASRSFPLSASETRKEVLLEKIEERRAAWEKFLKTWMLPPARSSGKKAKHNISASAGALPAKAPPSPSKRPPTSVFLPTTTGSSTSSYRYLSSSEDLAPPASEDGSPPEGLTVRPASLDSDGWLLKLLEHRTVSVTNIPLPELLESAVAVFNAQLKAALGGDAFPTVESCLGFTVDFSLKLQNAVVARYGSFRDARAEPRPEGDGGLTAEDRLEFFKRRLRLGDHGKNSDLLSETEEAFLKSIKQEVFHVHLPFEGQVTAVGPMEITQKIKVLLDLHVVVVEADVGLSRRAFVGGRGVGAAPAARRDPADLQGRGLLDHGVLQLVPVATVVPLGLPNSLVQLVQEFVDTDRMVVECAQEKIEDAAGAGVRKLNEMLKALLVRL